MKATITRPDGTIIDFEGTAEEYKQAFEQPQLRFNWPKLTDVPAQPLIPNPWNDPNYPMQPSTPYIWCNTDTGDGLFIGGAGGVKSETYTSPTDYNGIVSIY